MSKLILSLPHEVITATSGTVAEFATHRSPGSGKYYHGRSILVDLAIKDGKPDFEYLPEGGWRDAYADSVTALATVSPEGHKTKTALSNGAFGCTPHAAWRHVYLTKTGGEVLELEVGKEIAHFEAGSATIDLTPDQVAKAAGLTSPARRVPRLYMTFAPIEFLVLTSLTPSEYVWYSTRRPGKIFRQVAFAEVREDPALHLAAANVFAEARKLFATNPSKKTKTVVTGDCFNRVPFSSWIGYDREAPGGVYVGDSRSAILWSFPERIPRAWERAY